MTYCAVASWVPAGQSVERHPEITVSKLKLGAHDIVNPDRDRGPARYRGTGFFF
jgi:hypothetical protein